jgi:hypothetical protein
MQNEKKGLKNIPNERPWIARDSWLGLIRNKTMRNSFYTVQVSAVLLDRWDQKKAIIETEYFVK